MPTTGSSRSRALPRGAGNTIRRLFNLTEFIEELRNRIWDHLFRQGESQQIASIAEQLDETADVIKDAVQHPWFDVENECVAIARNDG